MSNPNDSMVIAVMGATGSGKSTFINLASGSQLQVGYGLESCTSDVEISIPFVMNGRLVTLVDTPGFDDTVKSEAEILRLIADFLAATYGSGRKLNGVVFMHRISDYRMGGVARKNFRLFRKICGDDTLKNVVIVTNMWGDVTDKIGANREKELSECDLFFKPALEQGAKMVRHGNTAESARCIIQRFLGNSPEALSIQREVVDEKKSVAETAAGLELQAELHRQLATYRQELKGIREEMEELMALKDKKHQAEIQELNDALGDVKAQVAKFEQAHETLIEERREDKREWEEKARQMARAMEEREALLQSFRERTEDQEGRIDDLHGTLADVQQKARLQQLQVYEMESNLADAERYAREQNMMMEKMQRDFDYKWRHQEQRMDENIATNRATLSQMHKEFDDLLRRREQQMDAKGQTTLNEIHRAFEDNIRQRPSGGIFGSFF